MFLTRFPKKIFKGVKTFTKNKYQCVCMTIYLWTLLNPFLNRFYFNNASLIDLVPIHRSMNDDLANATENDANRILYNMIKSDIQQATLNVADMQQQDNYSKIELCCNHNSSINNITIPSKNITTTTNNNRVKSDSSSTFFADAFSVTNNNNNNIPLRKPTKLFNNLFGANHNSNKTQSKTYISITDQPWYKEACAASGSSASGSGNSGSDTSSTNTNNDTNAIDKEIIDRQYGKNIKKRTKNKKKRKQKDKQSLTINYDQIIDNKQDLYLNEMKTKAAKSISASENKFKNTKTFKNSSLIESNKLDQFGSSLQPDYQNHIDNYLQHQDEITQPVSKEKFKRLAYNTEHKTPKLSKKSKPYTIKTIEECMAILTAENQGYVTGEIDRMTAKEFFEGNYNVDFVALSRNLDHESQKSLHEIKTAFPEPKKNETFIKMGERMTRKGISQCERGLLFDTSITHANVYIDHRNLNEQQSLEVTIGSESVVPDHPHIHVFQLNNKR